METEPPASKIGRRHVFRGLATNRRRVLADMFGTCARALFQSWRLHLVPAPRPAMIDFPTVLGNELLMRQLPPPPSWVWATLVIAAAVVGENYLSWLVP